MAANGSTLACEGTVCLSAINSRTGSTCILDALISSDYNNNFLLSWTDMIKLRIIAEDFPFSSNDFINNSKTDKKLLSCDVLKLSEDNCPRLKNILQDFPDVVCNVLPDHPMVRAPMEIELKAGYTPFKLAVPRSISHH